MGCTATATLRGESVPSTGAVNDNAAVSGGVAWYRNLHRYYDPAIGRYTQVDPIPGTDPDFPGHPYAYALNSPLRYTDPTGLAVWLCKRKANIPLNWLFGLQHNWIKTDACETGMGPAGGGVPGHGGVDAPGVQTSTVPHFGESNLPGVKCELQRDVNESCVNQQICQSIPTGRWMPWNQCQSWAASVLSNCKNCPKPPRWTMCP